DVATFARSGAPVYAECGGLMYLTESIVDVTGRSFPMVGVFPTRARVQPRLAAVGYLQIEASGDYARLEHRRTARGHEFRYSSIEEMPSSVPRHYRVRGRGGERPDGYAVGWTLASYAHLHFESCPWFASRFVAACAARKDDHR